MAELKGTFNYQVNQTSAGPSMFGLPGSGTGNPVLCDVSLTGQVKVYDDYSVTLSASGTISNPAVLPAAYPVALYVSANDWDFSYQGGSLVVPSGVYMLGATTITVTGSPRGPFTWNISTGDIPIGNLNDFHADTEGGMGVVYFGGTGTYSVDSPIYPTPVPIPVPGFIELRDYFPFATFDGSAWRSCNRAGGFVRDFEGGTWQDRKNGNATNTVLTFDGSTWQACPRIGEE